MSRNNRENKNDERVLGAVMSENPLISVCTPVYNGEDFLEECIKGVLAQRYSNFEYTTASDGTAS